MFRLIKKIFIGLVTGIVSAPNHKKCMLLSNQKCMIQPTLINLHPNEYSQKCHYYPLAVYLDRCVGSCNTLNDLSIKVCVQKKTEELNLSMLNMITGINELKTLTKHISCQCKCRFDGRKCNSDGGIMINVNVSVKNVLYLKKNIFGILLHVVMKMENV